MNTIIRGCLCQYNVKASLKWRMVEGGTWYVINASGRLSSDLDVKCLPIAIAAAQKVRDLMDSYGFLNFRINEAKAAGRVNGAMLVHAPVGWNLEPESKIAEFKRIISWNILNLERTRTRCKFKVR